MGRFQNPYFNLRSFVIGYRVFPPRNYFILSSFGMKYEFLSQIMCFGMV